MGDAWGKLLALGFGELLRNRNSALLWLCQGRTFGATWEFREDAKLSTRDRAVAGQAHMRSMADGDFKE